MAAIDLEPQVSLQMLSTAFQKVLKLKTMDAAQAMQAVKQAAYKSKSLNLRMMVAIAGHIAPASKLRSPN